MERDDSSAPWDRANLEGFDEIEVILTRDTDGYWHERALPLLLEVGNDKTITVACAVLKRERWTSPHTSPFGFYHRLFMAGRRECLDFLTGKLQDPKEGDRFAAEIAAWRTDGYRFDPSEPELQRAKARESLASWLEQQMVRIESGQSVPLRP